MVNQPEIQIGSRCFLNYHKQALIKDGIEIGLSRIEFLLLSRLVQDFGKPVSNEELIKYTWGTDTYVDKGVLYVYINRLRKLLNSNRKKTEFVIISLRGIGYSLNRYDNIKKVIDIG